MTIYTVDFTPSISDFLPAISVPIRGKKNRTSALPQPQISKSIKTHLFPTTFNQNTTTIVQNHTKTTPLFNTFRQNLFFLTFLRCCKIAPNHRTCATPFTYLNTHSFSECNQSAIISNAALNEKEKEENDNSL